LAVNKVRGDVNTDPDNDGFPGVSVEGMPSWFDMGTAEMMSLCSSCHIGGGPFEGQVQVDGSVTPWDSPTLAADNSYDRDFVSYSGNAITNAYYAATIEEAINIERDPTAANSDWAKTGVMEGDCLMCHLDPEGSRILLAADGIKADVNRPRMMIFAERDENGNVTKVSLGTPLHNGLENQVVRPYTDALQRMSRPTTKMALMQLPADKVGEMMAMWTQGLADIDAQNAANGTPLLPFALYGQNVAKIWDAETGMLKAEYCANPNGVMDEMQRMGANQEAIGQLFGGFLQYMIGEGFLPPEADMNMMMGMFFNDFIYGYSIKNAMDPSGNMLNPIPYGLRAYDQGRFYTNNDDFQASTRDYVRNPLVEGEGIVYTGRVGLVWEATMYGMGLAQGFPGTPFETTPNPEYMNANGMVATERVVADWQNDTLIGLPQGTTKEMFIKGALHDTLPSFFNVMPTAELMGYDMNGNGTPLTYVQLVKEGEEWNAKTYYEVGEITQQAQFQMHKGLFGGVDQADDPRWTKICGTCHVMLSDHNNSEVELVRKYNLGMSPDYVKNGQYVNMTTDQEAEGYDVHMSEGKLGCGSCHLQSSNYQNDKNGGVKDIENIHNFLKGTDTAHNVRNDLDNNIRPKNCEGCHIEQIAGPAGTTAADPTAAHLATFFGKEDYTAIHMEKIACQTCHIPYKKTWRFRAFDNTLGYFNNFDNRMGFNVLNYNMADPDAPVPGPGQMNIMAFPPEYAISPVYGASPGYGIPHFNMVSQALDANGNGQISMDYVSEMVDYFHLRKSGDPGKLVNGMPTNPQFDFWKYFYQMFFNQKAGMLGWDTPATGANGMMDPNAPDHITYPPLYYGNGTNGYPQVVTGNPITILTWADAAAGEGQMNNISYGGAKIMYLRELQATIDEYLTPTSLGTIDPMEMYMIPANSPAYRTHAGVGKVLLKPTALHPEGYVLYDHTGDMSPEIWWTEDARAVQAALKEVLAAEGKPDAFPALFMAAHYFSDTHGVKPASKALGANHGCNDCHHYSTADASRPGYGNQEATAGAHRITDRKISFLPWAPPWFNESNRLLKFNPETNAMEGTGAAGDDGNGAFFIVDGEVDYITPTGGNGLAFLGADEEDILELSHHHARHLFYQTHGEEILGSAIYGIDARFMSEAELNTLYVPQVSRYQPQYKGLSADYIPADIRHEVAAFGYAPTDQGITISDGGKTYTAKAKPLIYDLVVEGLHHPEDQYKGVMAMLTPAKDATIDGKKFFNPRVVFQPAGADFFDPWIVINDEDLPLTERRANVVRYLNNNMHKWILRAGPGRYAVVNPADMTEVVLTAEEQAAADAAAAEEQAAADAAAAAEQAAAEQAAAEAAAAEAAAAEQAAADAAAAEAAAAAVASSPNTLLVSGNKVNYAGNVAFCESLVAAGTNERNNWRPASLLELEATSNLAAGIFWSSTPAELPNGPGRWTYSARMGANALYETNATPTAICISE
jgi:hypothetical protein